jgi:hypothetical protein
VLSRYLPQGESRKPSVTITHVPARTRIRHLPNRSLELGLSTKWLGDVVVRCPTGQRFLLVFLSSSNPRAGSLHKTARRHSRKVPDRAKVSFGFPQFLQPNDGIISYMRARPIPFYYFLSPNHSTRSSQSYSASLNELQIHRTSTSRVAIGWETELVPEPVWTW